MASQNHLSPVLRELVRESVAMLGEVIRDEAGKEAYRRIENLRKKMARLRGAVARDSEVRELRSQLQTLKGLSPPQRQEVARAFTLMLELMNGCESAYRSHRIRASEAQRPKSVPDSMIYVLTAHPTEARAPEFISVFRQISYVLSDILSANIPSNRLKWTRTNRKNLLHWLKVAWKTPIVRARKPEVRDEAEHIYSALLRRETLSAILAVGSEVAPVYLRSWVGGDKDGHPGVDEKVFQESLALSRSKLVEFCLTSLWDIRSALLAMSHEALLQEWEQVLASVHALAHLQAGDAERALHARHLIRAFANSYERIVGAEHPLLSELLNLTRVFPAFVVPLEFRESSDVLMAPANGKKPIAMERMLARLAALSKGGDPRWYVRGLIVSMTGELAHLKAASKLVKRQLGSIRLPIVPLFENAAALRASETIVRELLDDRELSHALRRHWDSYLEIMVGYSDSSKENGVLPSRRMIAEAMHALDRLCHARKVVPLFFQGSGGSVDRGGGSIPEQTAWWPSGALRNYKVTLQGEMVERSLATPEITRRQLERIALSAGAWNQRARRRLAEGPSVREFADRVSKEYRAVIREPAFLRMIEAATPYRFLDALRIGSRPTKRAQQLSVDGLRAIPWVLCWTQSRVLFPTWWGVGTAWKEASSRQKSGMKKAFRSDPLFATYVRALVFTLAKVQLPVWYLYLERSGLPQAEALQWRDRFEKEFQLAVDFARGVLGKQPLRDWTPWLIESIALRSPMIHPLNLLQLLALEDQDSDLLRLSVTGIASGMMTTG
jgi:phosphoenolpyruvate carboxylase